MINCKIYLYSKSNEINKTGIISGISIQITQK